MMSVSVSLAEPLDHIIKRTYSTFRRSWNGSLSCESMGDSSFCLFLPSINSGLSTLECLVLAYHAGSISYLCLLTRTYLQVLSNISPDSCTQARRSRSFPLWSFPGIAGVQKDRVLTSDATTVNQCQGFVRNDAGAVAILFLDASSGICRSSSWDWRVHSTHTSTHVASYLSPLSA